MKLHSENHSDQRCPDHHEGTKSQKKQCMNEQLKDLEEGWRGFHIHLREVPEKGKEETVEKQYVWDNR